MEAYNVEQGVTNYGFPNERDTDPGCQFNATPEDDFNAHISAECSTQGPATVYARVTRRGQVSSFMPFCTPGREPIRSPQACRCFSPALSGRALRPA